MQHDNILANILANIDPSQETIHKKLANIELRGRCETQLIRQPTTTESTISHSQSCIGIRDWT